MQPIQHAARAVHCRVCLCRVEHIHLYRHIMHQRHVGTRHQIKQLLGAIL